MSSRISKGVVGFSGYSYSPAIARNRAEASPWMQASEMVVPSRMAYRHLAMRPPSAMGDNGAAAAGLGVVTIGALVALAVAINYQLGKAMAPSAAVEGKWAWGNAIGGTLFPPTPILLAVWKNYFL
jgi:hypothetical protein